MQDRLDQDPIIPVAPIDPVDLRRVLTAIYKSMPDGDDARPRLVKLFKQIHQDSRAHAERELMRNGDGRACAAYLSATMDEIVSAIHDYAAAHVYHRSTDDSEMAIVATGGYGRGLLAPGSDVDLLFLMPSRDCPWGESVAEYMLYLLWDVGLKVGHATRNVDQCVRLSHADATIRTALLDARHVHGDAHLFQRFEEKFWADVTRSSARAFVDAKMAERDSRHRRSGASRFLVEPNIKDGKGGLRDLHTLHWLSKYLTGYAMDSKANEGDVFMPSEMATFRRCEDFLWTVRCHLHFLTGRAEERLTFDVQPEMAARLSYKDRKGLQAVERFMKHYFLVAKDVGDLTRILSSALELRQLKTVPKLNELFNPLTWTARRRVRTATEFRIENDRIALADADVFNRDPVNMFRIFRVAEETGALFHPDVFRRMRRSLRLIDDKVRRSPEAARIFLDLVADSRAPEAMLRRMHSADLLGRYMPEFQTVTSMMQFNMYHHYTVDEHLLRTVGELNDIEKGKAAEELPLSTEIFPSIKNRRLLYLTALIHDIGKGRAEDHSILGARLARRICERLGLTASETETVVWLVREHLLMSTTSQSRDLSDPRTISDFTQAVGSLDRLKLLLLLTVADIRAVGPGTWNGWKGQLLRQLYYSSAAQLSDAEGVLPRPDQVASAQDELRQALEHWPREEVDAVIARHYDDYWLRTDLETQIAHAKLLRQIGGQERKIATSFTSDAFTQITLLNVVAPNHPRLLSLFAGCCAAAGADIITAQISTTRDGLVLDDFQLERAFDSGDDEDRRSRRITDTIERVLKGEVRLAALLENQTRPTSRMRAFSVKPEVSVDNSLSDTFTVIDVAGADRPGLLYDLTSALSDLNLDIVSARIATFGERAVDAFYVTDLTGKKIVDPARREQIAERLSAVLANRALVA